MALPWYGLIGSSKAALESMVRHLTLEIGDRGVNINVVKAGLVETDSTRRIPNSDEMFRHRKDKTMTGDRMLTVDDVANAVMFLASPLADLVQGETLTVDGGARGARLKTIVILPMTIHDGCTQRKIFHNL